MKIIIHLMILLILLANTVVSRPDPNIYSELISDGSNELTHNVIQLKGIESSSTEVEEETMCEQMYGFLPCSRSVPGHLFLIIVYEYLLFHGESYVASGGERIFKILGPGVFGASAFQVIGSLPEALILLASGLLSNAETAEECVLTGVGLLAGSTILHLTLIWGTCILLGAQNFPNSSRPNLSRERDPNSIEKLSSSLWPRYGVVTDLGTTYIAMIMLLSVIPLIFILLSRIFESSYLGERVLVLVTLGVSVVFLFSYFFYQFFQPWIQKRQLLYIKHEHLVVDVLKHVQKQTMGNLLKDSGSPNIARIRSFVEKKDVDGDKVISFPELKQFLQEIKFRELPSDQDGVTAEILNEFDTDSDQMITIDEFVNGMTKWLGDTKDTLNKRYHSVKSLKNVYKVLKPWVEKKREEREMMKRLIPDIVFHLQNSIYGNLLAENGTPDVAAIKRLFKNIDIDKDDCISYSELKELLTNIKFGLLPYDADVAASKIMEELDVSGDQAIDEDEFVSGFTKWINTAYKRNSNSEESEEDNYQKSWEQTDKLVEDKFIDKSPLAWIKAVSFLVLGIFMLGVLAEPLIKSVRDFSESAEVQPFFVAFIFVPFASNARFAISAISEARNKKLHTTSLTLSEIYGSVFINNVLGFSVLLLLVYVRGIAWNFSVEILMVLVVSTIIGIISSFSTVFSIWTSALAYLLYPLSLILVYFFVGDFSWIS